MNNSLVRKYDNLADQFAEQSYANLVFYMNRRFSIARSWGPILKPGDSLLEIGCGDGYLGEIFVSQGFHYCGLDISPKMIEALNHRLKAKGLIADSMVGDISQMQLEKSYDGIVSFMRSFFCYVHNPVSVLKELRLKIRKKIIIDVNPRKKSLGEALSALREAGFRNVSWQPFFIPKDKKLPKLILNALILGESIPFVRNLPLKWKFHCLLKGTP